MAATRRIERTQESRRLLVTAAAELFAEKGYRQTSFIDIAERAGISRGSIPWHFGNKLGLLESVVDDRLQAVLAGLPPVPGEPVPGELSGDPLDQVMDFIRLPATRLFITLLAEAVEAGSPIREHYARLHAALRQAVRARIPAEALPPGTTSEALTVLLVGAVIGVHAQWRVAPEAVDLEAVRATVRALLPAGLGLA
ncbi:TetR family transcriptional regulator [Planomonospora parontospora subsp. parontospora]|uniref:TetR family transcriptional regulator n=2 Tax=Planomonospora parontospora TaxID=58119 RepID=A0AA37F1X4_9ACTN|nr:TetR/AcrR family transcriptional regulator [Planomonospora parontospora]GGK44881.1 TetR family transcriptional regulator [Planomonospora parontospora]GII06255.1 TetR family transcriptional regulator [Planomonospora parontospora subsp. parontospora]